MLYRVAQPAGPNPRKKLRTQGAADLTGTMQLLVSQLPTDASFFPQEGAVLTPAGSTSASATGVAGELTPEGPSSSAGLHEVTPGRRELEAQAAAATAATFLLDSPLEEGAAARTEAEVTKEVEDRPEATASRAPDEPEPREAGDLEVPVGGSPPRVVEVVDLERDGAPKAPAEEPAL